MNYNSVPGSSNEHNVTIYALSTCPHCTKAKNYFSEKKISYKYINVDLATRDEKREVALFLKKHNMPIAFPVIVIDEAVIQGFNLNEIEKYLSPIT